MQAGVGAGGSRGTVLTRLGSLFYFYFSVGGAGSVDGIIGGKKEESRQWDGGSSVEIRCIISFIFSNISM